VVGWRMLRPWTATNFFSSRKRCCDQCLTRTLTVDDQEVTEYYHRGVVCHLIGQDLAIPPDKDVVVVVKGDHRLLLQDAEGLFSQRAADGRWTERRRTVQYWDAEGFTSCEGVSQPLRVLHTLETERRRERIARQWKETETTSSWYWATTFSQRRLPVRQFWRAGHWRWDIENGCFNTTSTHWGLNHVFKHEPTAIVNFVLTLFLAFTLPQCFWQRNLKSPFRNRFTLIGLAAELYQGLVDSPCARARAP
jgi:hypothetical protein